MTTKRLDPRLYQIAVLAGLLLFGLTVLDFDLTIAQLVVTLGAAVVTQLACARVVGLRGDTGIRSALISGLSLCLLLRTDVLSVAAAAAGLAIGSKFVAPRRRQAPAQPHKRRDRRPAHARNGVSGSRSVRLGVAGPMGQHRVLPAADGVPRHHRRHARGAG